MQDYLINNVLNYYCGAGGRERVLSVCKWWWAFGWNGWLKLAVFVFELNFVKVPVRVTLRKKLISLAMQKVCRNGTLCLSQADTWILDWQLSHITISKSVRGTLGTLITLIGAPCTNYDVSKTDKDHHTPSA